MPDPRPLPPEEAERIARDYGCAVPADAAVTVIPQGWDWQYRGEPVYKWTGRQLTLRDGMPSVWMRKTHDYQIKQALAAQGKREYAEELWGRGLDVGQIAAIMRCSRRLVLKYTQACRGETGDRK